MVGWREEVEDNCELEELPTLDDFEDTKLTEVLLLLKSENPVLGLTGMATVEPIGESEVGAR